MICLAYLELQVLDVSLADLLLSSVSSSTTTGERNLQIRHEPSNFFANFAATKFELTNVFFFVSKLSRQC